MQMRLYTSVRLHLSCTVHLMSFTSVSPRYLPDSLCFVCTDLHAQVQIPAKLNRHYILWFADCQLLLGNKLH